MVRPHEGATVSSYDQLLPQVFPYVTEVTKEQARYLVLELTSSSPVDVQSQLQIPQQPVCPDTGKRPVHAGLEYADAPQLWAHRRVDFHLVATWWMECWTVCRWGQLRSGAWMT